MRDVNERIMLIGELLAQIEANIEHLTEKRAELGTALEAIATLENEDTDALIPLSQGIYISAHIPRPERFIVGVGSDVLVEKSAADLTHYIQDRIKDIETSLERLREQYAQLAREYEQIKKVTENV